jgi:RNase P/RNase MRP subunit p30
MKKFADLHLQPDLENREKIETLVRKASELGYSLLGVSLPSIIKQDTVSFLKKTCNSYDVDFATRIDLTSRSSGELLNSLGRFRRKFELLSVSCFSKSVARQAAKDHRVDLLVFPSVSPHERFFDLAEARLASQGVAALEIDMSLLLFSEGSSRARLLSCLRKEAATAKKLNVPVVISSHATDPYQLREPQEVASLAMLFGMEHVSALNAVSNTPLTIVERNRKKLDTGYVAKGIHVMRRGKNCDN